MEVGFFGILENVYEQVNESTTSVLESVEDANLKAKYLKELEEILVSCVTTQHKVAITRQAVKETIARAQDEETQEPDANIYDDLLEESIGELEVDSPLEGAIAQAASLKTFKDLLEQNNVSANSDGDLVATECSNNFLDPISKKRMTDPVRNKICDHVYDRGSITSMISKSKNKFKCPAIGCANRKPIKVSDLKEAPDVKRQLTLQKRRQ
ncbi:E3 SUMO-protein ligase NSE2-like [Scylla paramamosain]|uniref:E3 SUMO-protein ligase NSE2 n=1 Tax=Scylla paramamosain TaxID=85552 RepID=I7FET3_SCYPA|nr:E3 SUMO-protein ligase NSE2 [Scylla paramamosain]